MLVQNNDIRLGKLVVYKCVNNLYIILPFASALVGGTNQDTMGKGEQARANEGMRDLRFFMQFGVSILRGINPKTLKRIQENLGRHKKILYEKLQKVVKPDGKTKSGVEDKLAILHDPQSGLTKLASQVAKFLEDPDLFEHITPKSAAPLLRCMKWDEEMEDNNLLRRIASSLEQGALDQGARAGAAGGSRDKLTPSGSSPDDSACGKRDRTELHEIWGAVQQLNADDLRTLNERCLKLLKTREETTPMQCEDKGAAGAASGKKVGAEDDQGRNENGLLEAKAWSNNAWHPDIKKQLKALQEAKKVDIEKLDVYVLDNLKSLPFEVALVALQKRMNEDGKNIQNESRFFEKNCTNLRNQWSLEDFEVEKESSDDDHHDDDNSESGSIDPG